MSGISDELDPHAIEEILRRRARQLEGRQRNVAARTIRHHVIEFVRGGETYGIPIHRVVEARWVSISCLPGLPSAVSGLFQIRGSVYSLADLSALFDAATTQIQHRQTVLALVVQSAEGPLGLRADSLLGPRELSADECGERSEEDFFLDVSRDLMAVIDVDRLALRPEIRVTPS